MMDFIRPPQVLSRETSADEVNWSVGTYVAPSVIERAFKLKAALPAPRGVAPHQPNPHGPTLKRMGQLGLVFTGMLMLFAVIMSALSDDRVVLNERVDLVTPSRPSAKKQMTGMIMKGQPIRKVFATAGRGNMAISVTSDVQNAWLYVSGRLINETLGTTKDFGVQVSYHSGYAGGSSWASGARRRTVYVGGLSAGEYSVTLTPEWSAAGKVPTRFDIAIRSQVFMGSHVVVMTFLLWLLPLIQAIRYYVFERKRWAESDYA